MGVAVRGHRLAPGVRNFLKSLVTGPSLLLNCYLEIKSHNNNKKQGEAHPPPPPFMLEQRQCTLYSTNCALRLRLLSGLNCFNTCLLGCALFYKPIWQLTVNERGHYADSEDTFLFKIEDIPDTRLGAYSFEKSY